MRLEKYGPASERLNDEQLELLEQEPGVGQREVRRRLADKGHNGGNSSDA